MRVLVLAHSLEILQVVPSAIMQHWPQSTVTATCEHTLARELAAKEGLSLVVLDLTLMDEGSLNTLAAIRAASSVAITVLTGVTTAHERVRVLDAGADDLVATPFSSAELAAHIRAVMRRMEKAAKAHAPAIERGGLVINFDVNEVLFEGRTIKLTPIQHKLMCSLATGNGEPVPQDKLITTVWGEEYLDAPGAFLKVHIHRLRKKLGDSIENPRVIITVPGKGYRFGLPTL